MREGLGGGAPLGVPGRLARLAVFRLRVIRRWTLLCRLTLMTGTDPSAATGGAHGDDDDTAPSP